MLVTKAWSPEMITAKAVHASAQRSRSCIPLAYLYLEDIGDEEAVKKHFVDIEVTSKCYRTHRGPGDQQSCFIKKLYDEVVEME